MLIIIIIIINISAPTNSFVLDTAHYNLYLLTYLRTYLLSSSSSSIVSVKKMKCIVSASWLQSKNYLLYSM